MGGIPALYQSLPVLRLFSRGLRPSVKCRGVEKGGVRGATAPPLGAIFALKYLKNEAELGKNGQKI